MANKELNEEIERAIEKRHPDADAKTPAVRSPSFKDMLAKAKNAAVDTARSASKKISPLAKKVIGKAHKNLKKASKNIASAAKPHIDRSKKFLQSKGMIKTEKQKQAEQKRMLEMKKKQDLLHQKVLKEEKKKLAEQLKKDNAMRQAHIRQRMLEKQKRDKELEEFKKTANKHKQRLMKHVGKATSIISKHAKTIHSHIKNTHQRAWDYLHKKGIVHTESEIKKQSFLRQKRQEREKLRNVSENTKKKLEEQKRLEKQRIEKEKRIKDKQRLKMIEQKRIEAHQKRKKRTKKLNDILSRLEAVEDRIEAIPGKIRQSLKQLLRKRSSGRAKNLNNTGNNAKNIKNIGSDAVEFSSDMIKKAKLSFRHAMHDIGLRKTNAEKKREMVFQIQAIEARKEAENSKIKKQESEKRRYEQDALRKKKQKEIMRELAERRRQDEARRRAEAIRIKEDEILNQRELKIRQKDEQRKMKSDQTKIYNEQARARRKQKLSSMFSKITSLPGKIKKGYDDYSKQRAADQEAARRMKQAQMKADEASRMKKQAQIKAEQAAMQKTKEKKISKAQKIEEKRIEIKKPDILTEKGKINKVLSTIKSLPVMIQKKHQEMSKARAADKEATKKMKEAQIKAEQAAAKTSEKAAQKSKAVSVQKAEAGEAEQKRRMAADLKLMEMQKKKEQAAKENEKQEKMLARQKSMQAKKDQFKKLTSSVGSSISSMGSFIGSSVSSMGSSVSDSVSKFMGSIQKDIAKRKEIKEIKEKEKAEKQKLAAIKKKEKAVPAAPNGKKLKKEIEMEKKQKELEKRLDEQQKREKELLERLEKERRELDDLENQKGKRIVEISKEDIEKAVFSNNVKRKRFYLEKLETYELKHLTERCGLEVRKFPPPFRSTYIDKLMEMPLDDIKLSITEIHKKEEGEIPIKPAGKDLEIIGREIEKQRIHAREVKQVKTAIKTQGKQVTTGIEGFDALVKKGIPRGSAVVISGTSGTGKTIFCLQTLMNQAKKGEKCLYISLEERPEKLMHYMKTFGWNPKKYTDSGNLVIQRLSPMNISTSIEALLAKAKGELLIEADPMLIPEGFNPDWIVIDSLGAFSSAFGKAEENYRTYIEQLFKYLEGLKCTSLLISETEEIPKIGMTRGRIEDFLGDAIIIFYHIRRGNIRQRAIEILKMRGVEHEEKVVAMQIVDKQGVMIYPEQEVFGGLE